MVQESGFLPGQAGAIVEGQEIVEHQLVQTLAGTEEAVVHHMQVTVEQIVAFDIRFGMAGEGIDLGCQWAQD